MSPSSAVNGLMVEGLRIRYADGEPALDGLSLRVPERSIYAILGPSGCGKSTLLRAVAGLIRSYEGVIAFGGRPVNPRETVIGLVPQHYGLLPWKSVDANIRTALRIARPGRGDVRQETDIIESWLATMGIGGLRHRYPLSLSGGQQQRVAIARAFALQPDLLLLDEPFSAVDAMTRETLQELFLANWAAHPATTLFVTHDVEEAVLLGQRIVVMPRAGGRSLQLLDNPVFSLEHGKKRESGAFFEQTNALRKVMREQW